MKRWSLRGNLYLYALLAAFVLSAVPGTGSAFRNIKEGAPAVAIALKDVEGKDVSIAPDSGKLTVLSFVKVSQEKSVELVKDLAVLQKELGPKGVDFYIIASYTDTVEEAKKLAADLSLPIPILMDKDQKAYGDYGLFILPAVGVIGKDGKFAFEYSSHGRDFKDVVGGKLKVLAGLMAEDDYKKLVTPVETAQKSKEESEAERLLALGSTLYRRGMADKAVEKYAKAVELDPKNIAARIGYGDCLVAAKKYDEALAQFEKAKEISPQSKEAQLGLGVVQLQKGDTEKAIETIQEAAMLNPKPEKANYWLGAAYEKKGDLPNAVKYYRKAIEKLLKD